jgi:hypothetical protein
MLKCSLSTAKSKMTILMLLPIPVAKRSKARVCGRSLAEVAGSNHAGGMDVLSLVSVVCCQVEVSAAGRSLVQRSPTDWCAIACNLETSSFRRP